MEGAATQPQVRLNRIHHGEQYGMFITDKAGGVIEANRFYANTWAAVAFTEGGDSLVVSNVLSRGFHYGLYCFDNGRGHCVSNYVYRNKDAGLSVASGGAPLVEHNEFMHGHSFGCYFFLKGMGEVRNNKVRERLLFFLIRDLTFVSLDLRPSDCQRFHHVRIESHSDGQRHLRQPSRGCVGATGRLRRD